MARNVPRELHPQLDADIRAARQRNDRLRAIHQLIMEAAVESRNAGDLEDLLVEIDSAGSLIRNMMDSPDEQGDSRKPRRDWVVTDTEGDQPSFTEALRAAEAEVRERYDNGDRPPPPPLDPEWASPQD